MDGAYVAKLIYRFKTERNIQIHNPQPLEWDTPVFTMYLEGDQATLEMKEHHGTPAAARGRAEGYLRSWEIDFALRTGGRIRLEFERADIVDSTPEQATIIHEVTLKDHVLVADAGVYSIVGSESGLSIQSNEYPKPPTTFVASPLVETLWTHYNAYLEGRERLTDMGYFCVTALAAAAGGNDAQAAKQFSVSREVIRTLRRLSSEVGTKETVRKVTPRTRYQPHTPHEEAWIQTVIAILVRRAGERAANPGAALPEITMADLPKLP